MIALTALRRYFRAFFGWEDSEDEVGKLGMEVGGYYVPLEGCGLLTG